MRLRNSGTGGFDDLVRFFAFSSNHHLLGTAAMLPRELGAVVDPQLVVYGTENVRVVDASALPTQISGHLTSTLYAVAERAADIVKER
ncbi:GMC oxidoreductase-domain-containing protein [Aspergillus pseudodeflectus]|uniref:GMC oxidoreductase-domain-containing protein n=1 Tax=Aspergillus pseudodeflectus TaxID=176178 RepID=A0ABR4K772_9EURO